MLFCEIFKNTYFEEHLRTTVSNYRSSFLEVLCSCYSALINAGMKYSFSTAEVQSWRALHANLLKNLHSITGIFQRIFPQVQNSDIEKCILWLLLRTNLFWKHSCMAASQRQLPIHIHFRNSYIYFTFLTLTSC